MKPKQGAKSWRKQHMLTCYRVNDSHVGVISQDETLSVPEIRHLVAFKAFWT